MIVDTKNMLSVTDVNRNFSKATRIADESGQVLIMKGNKPKYLLININLNPQLEMSEEEKMEYIGRRILKQHINAFKELAKW